MGSRIPLHGLAHKVRVFEKTPQDDGAGGIELGAEVDIIASWKCRVSIYRDKEQLEDFGQAGRKLWSVIGKVNKSVEESQYIQLVSGNAVIDQTDVFRVVRVYHAQDDFGKLHHTSVLMELEDGDT